MSISPFNPLIPAKAGTHDADVRNEDTNGAENVSVRLAQWVPACAGMSGSH
jgi:hypothetical protein